MRNNKKPLFLFISLGAVISSVLGLLTNIATSSLPEWLSYWPLLLFGFVFSLVVTIIEFGKERTTKNKYVKSTPLRFSDTNSLPSAIISDVPKELGQDFSMVMPVSNSSPWRIESFLSANTDTKEIAIYTETKFSFLGTNETQPNSTEARDIVDRLTGTIIQDT